MTGFRQRLVYALVIINIVPHFKVLPSWIPTCALIFVCWRWLADLIRIPVPGRVWAALIALFGSAAVYGEFGKFIGDEASTGLLVIMVALKVFEIRRYRDVMFVTVLCFLLLMSLLLSEASVWATAFMFIDIALILSLMHYFHLPENNTAWPIGRTVRLLIQSVPVLIVLFLLFPRFNLGWFKRAPQNFAQSGFSGKLNPGSLSQLVLSEEQAFRAFFHDDRPPMNRLYWRGAVLNEVSGLNWDRSPLIRQQKVISDVQGERVEIMLEPNGTRWLFTLEWPVKLEISNALAARNEIWEHAGRTYESRTPIGSLWRYAFRYNSNPSAQVWDTNTDFSPYLKVNEPGEKTKKLLYDLRAFAYEPQKAVAAIRDFFIREKFTYSLSPPQVNSAEEFLFESRQGFCEHFASVTAILLRHMKIPARVVVGYHGGTPSLLGDYTIVAQKDAHAWAEYWNRKTSRWTRVDPTFWIAPGRIDLGASTFYQDSLNARLADGENALLKTLFGDDILLWLAKTSLLWDQLQVSYVSFLLRYDFSYQRSLLQRFGIEQISRFWLGVLSFVFVFLLVGLLYWIFALRLRVKPDRLGRLQALFMQKLRAAGLQVSPTQGPMAVERASVEKWPQQQSELSGIFNSLVSWRYGGEAHTRRDISVLRQRIRRLNLKGS